MNSLKVLTAVLWACCAVVYSQGSFPPAAGLPGSTAIHKDSSIIIGWASHCEIDQGYINIADTNFEVNDSNYPTVGSDSSAIGEVDGYVVSLGDGGSATVSFSSPIQNNDGPDFAIFENGFEDQTHPGKYFLELAFVEVSSDGQRFVRFPVVSYTQTDSQMVAFGHVDPTQVHNLAGKYAKNYGTPFDLDDIKDSTGIDINAISHIRIIDVIGSIDDLYAQHDYLGNKVNDPWPTPFANCGFDLDAVAILNTSAVLINSQQINLQMFKVFPNPVNIGGQLNIEVRAIDMEAYVSISDLSGRIYIKRQIDKSSMAKINLPDDLQSGIYCVQYSAPSKVVRTKIVVQSK